MKFLDLPNGRKMPALGLGTWQAIGKELEETLETALSLGYRHFDTATLYDNEIPIGRVLKRWINDGKLQRADLFVTTKLPPAGMYPGGVEHFLSKSLANLQLDYVDLYLIHLPYGIPDIPGKDPDEIEEDENVDRIAVWKELEAQVSSGLAKSIGISNFTKDQIAEILKYAVVKPANLQVELHVYCQQKGLVEYCQKNNISVVAYSPLGSPGSNDFHMTYGEVKNIPSLLQNATIALIAAKHNKTTAQIILKHAIQRGVGAIPKSTNPYRLRENIDIFDFEMDAEDMAKLDELDLNDK